MQPLSKAEYHFILRRDLMSFIERSFYELNPGKKLIPNAHIEVLASMLERCRKGEIKRLIVTLPPRSLKSHTVSVAFVAWLLAHDPTAQIICVSYNQNLAEKHSRDTRTLMTRPFYQQHSPGTQLSSEKQSVDDFMTTQQGFRMATSIEGPLTGRGGDFIIIDDPIKPEDAMSKANLKKVNEWYNNTLLSRLNNKLTGCIIIVMQRLHQDDLVGHVLAQEDWTVLSFPAIAETETVHRIESPLGKREYRRSVGDILDPQRESRVSLENTRQYIGTYNFMCQYQQNPIPIGGAMVEPDWFKYYQNTAPLPKFAFILQSWDTANKSGELNDYSVCTTWGVFNGDYYLLDVYRQRVNFPELKRAVKDQVAKFRSNEIVIEDKASGTQLIQDLKLEGAYNIKPYAPPPSTDKIMRLHAQTAIFESGRVILPNEAPWLTEYVRELTSFPGSKYDDQVDSTTQALDYLQKFSGMEVWAKFAKNAKSFQVSPPWRRGGGYGPRY